MVVGPAGGTLITYNSHSIILHVEDVLQLNSVRKERTVELDCVM